MKSGETKNVPKRVGVREKMEGGGGGGEEKNFFLPRHLPAPFDSFQFPTFGNLRWQRSA